MVKQIRIKVEKVDTETGEVIESTEIKRHDLKRPTGPHDFGLNQREECITESLMAYAANW